MRELSDTFDPRSATCAICNRPCDLTTCKSDEQGHPVHEHCYTTSLKKDASEGDC